VASSQLVGPACGLCLAAILAACGSSSSPSNSGSAPEGSLCPRCLAGGETTDFSGNRTCSGINASATDRNGALAREFAIDDLLSRLEQPIRSSLGWRRRPGGSFATGFERQTEVEFRIDVLGLSHGNWLVGAPPLCSDFLLLDTRIHLQTADGAMSGSFERPLLFPRNSSAALLESFDEGLLEIELRDFTGTLDLGVDPERIYDGSIGMSFSVTPDSMQGRLNVRLWYREGGLARWLFTPLEAHWPADGCDDGWLRVDPDEPIHPSDGRTARAYWQRSRSRFAKTFPVNAHWLDAGTTEVELQPGELEAACQDLSAPAAYYVAVPLQVRTTDGRLTTTQSAHVYFRTDDDAAERVTVEGETAAGARFADEVSVRDRDWSDTSEVTFELLSNLGRDSAPSGDLQIFGFDREARGAFENLLYLHWCSGSECEGYPRARYSPGGLNGIRLP
jgi:hypothetical protein